MRTGYRHLDTADLYRNMNEVGVAIQESIAEGVIQGREDLYIVTKITDDFSNIHKHLDEDLQTLGVEYVDLYVISPGGDYIIYTHIEKLT